MNDLLNDLKEEGYQDALANGNLRGKPRDTLERFTSAGYRAIICSVKCTSCGFITRTLSGIMHHEIGDKGSSRAQSLHLGHTPNIDTSPKPISYLAGKTGVCINCVGAWGFSLNPELEEKTHG